MSTYHWQCQDCGSYCDTAYRSDALVFGKEHRCHGRQTRRTVKVTSAAPIVKLDSARLRRLMRAVEKRAINE